MFGGVAEWLKAAVLKTDIGFTPYRGFESHPHRRLILPRLRGLSLATNLCVCDRIEICKRYLSSSRSYSFYLSALLSALISASLRKSAVMFNHGEIWAYPTDTSFGLGVRADDISGLGKLSALKGGRSEKYFSLMCANEKMLRKFAEVPDHFDVHDFFFTKPRTALFKPTDKLPQSKFWPSDKVAFRVSTIPEVAKHIAFPITATSGNLGGEEPIFTVERLRKVFGDGIQIYDKIPELTPKPSSEIWDYTIDPPQQLR